MSDSNENKLSGIGRFIPMAGAAAAALLLGTSPLSANSTAATGGMLTFQRTLGARIHQKSEETDMNRPSQTEQGAEGILLSSVHQSPESIAEECRKLLAYSDAVSSMSEAADVESLRKVGESLAGLGDFMNAAELSEECFRQADYLDALTLIKDEVEPEVLYTALNMLEGLGDYRDAATLAEECGQKAAYADALSLMGNELSRESLEGAMERFKSLGDYEDSAQKAEECADKLQVLAAYETALSDMEDEKYAKAATAFKALGDFADSREMARVCKLMTEYKEAAALYDARKYKPAHKALNALARTYKDADAVVTARGEISVTRMRDVCLNERRLLGVQYYIKEGMRDKAIEKLKTIEWSNLTAESQQLLIVISEQLGEASIYDKAVAYYNEGSYYQAYKAFLECGKAKDAEEMAQKCIQPFPETGVVYESKDYADRSSQLTIDNTGFMNAYYKLYLGENLVMTVFIPENEKVTFTLPAGSYKMKKAYGDLWFGTEDLFGDEGFYWNCSFGDGKDIATIESGYGYAIVSGDDGTGIGTKAMERGEF